MNEDRLSRLELLVGRTGLEKLAAAQVAVFGVGGVGSYAVEALARAGVGRLTLVDFDVVCLSNVNRQIHALEGTVGRPKVEVMAERCRAINPAVQVDARQVFYDAPVSEELLAADFAYVLDCIDNITSKLHLIQACRERQLPIISSMGAANKLDPKQLRVADLAETSKCRLARIMRKELRKRGIERGVRVVYSSEEFRPLQAAPEGGSCPAPEPGQARQRVVLGSSSYVPPLFGLTMAGEVIRALLGE